MDEILLHHIWQFQDFDLGNLQTTCGKMVKVFEKGHHNSNAGPDFSNARLSIDGLLWAGHVEIHTKASEWNNHKHQHDDRYSSVILHVVWEHDSEVKNYRGETLPTIELKNRVNPAKLIKYQSLKEAPTRIPCARYLESIPSIVKTDQLQKNLVERLQRKSQSVLELLQKNRGDWNITTLHILARSFGGHLNQDPFLRTISSIPLSLILKNIDTPLTIEAIVFGQAGFLSEEIDPYTTDLLQEYSHLSKAHNLSPRLKRSEWNFHRLRPNNFPSVRLAQFASVIINHPLIFDKLATTETMDQLTSIFLTELHEYWNHHFDFGKRQKSSGRKKIGRDFEKTLVINGLVPVLSAASQYFDQVHYMDKALSWLEELKPERNKFTDLMEESSFPVMNAAESQGVLELYSNYCLKKRCLSCNIGVRIMRK